MTTENKTLKAATLKTLHSKLTKFGLNPKQWSLRPTGPGEVMIQSTQDQGLIFLGKVLHREVRSDWHSIVLFSL